MDNQLNYIREHIIKKLMEKTRDSSIDFLKLDESSFGKQIEALFRSILREDRISLERGLLPWTGIL